MENYVNCFFQITRKAREEHEKLNDTLGILEDLLGIQQYEILELLKGRLRDRHKVHLLVGHIFDELDNTHLLEEEYQYEALIDIMSEKELEALVESRYLDIRDPDEDLIKKCDTLFHGFGDILEIDSIMNRIRELEPNQKVELKELIGTLELVKILNITAQKKGRGFILKMLGVI